MNTTKKITQQKQRIARYEQSLVSEQLKKRRADTRRKIELGGLVIKSGMDGFSKAVILGALNYSLNLMHQETQYQLLFENKGNDLFIQ